MKLVEVGRVARSHGLRGEVRVELHWAQSDALFGVDDVVLTRGGEPPLRIRVEGARPGGKAVLLKLSGIDDRDAADGLRGHRVSVNREALPPLAPGEYYLCDLVGMRVIGPDGEIGKVVEIRVHPSVESLVIQTPGGDLLEQPVVPPWIESVDVEQHVVVLSSTAGLF